MQPMVIHAIYELFAIKYWLTLLILGGFWVIFLSGLLSLILLSLLKKSGGGVVEKHSYTFSDISDDYV